MLCAIQFSNGITNGTSPFENSVKALEQFTALCLATRVDSKKNPERLPKIKADHELFMGGANLELLSGSPAELNTPEKIAAAILRMYGSEYVLNLDSKSAAAACKFFVRE
jgi:hypothetical protein